MLPQLYPTMVVSHTFFLTNNCIQNKCQYQGFYSIEFIYSIILIGKIFQPHQHLQTCDADTFLISVTHNLLFSLLPNTLSPWSSKRISPLYISSLLPSFLLRIPSKNLTIFTCNSAYFCTRALSQNWKHSHSHADWIYYKVLTTNLKGEALLLSNLLCYISLVNSLPHLQGISFTPSSCLSLFSIFTLSWLPFSLPRKWNQLEEDFNFPLKLSPLTTP